jgi:hypothetical protein
VVGRNDQRLVSYSLATCGPGVCGTGPVPGTLAARMNALIAGAGDDDDAEAEFGEDGRALFAQIRDDPGNVSLATVREEVAKLAAIRAIGLPTGVFAGLRQSCSPTRWPTPRSAPPAANARPDADDRANR